MARLIYSAIVRRHSAVLWLLVPFVLASCSKGEREPKSFGDPPFNSNAGEFVQDTEAGDQAREYQGDYKGNNHAVYVSNRAIDELQKAAGPTCVGLRMYRSVNKEGRIGLVLVGVDAKGNDLADQINGAPSLQQRVIASYEKCPDNCDEQASLLDNHKNKKQP